MASGASRLTPQAVLGLLIIAAGLLLTADNLGWYEADRIIRLWPLGIVLVGVLKFVQSDAGSGRVLGAILMFVGGVLTADITFGLPATLDDLWPLVLVVLGVVILSRTLRSARQGTARSGLSGPDDTFSRMSTLPPSAPPPPAPPRPGEFAAPPSEPEETEAMRSRADESVSEVAVWAGKQRRVSVPTFRRGDLTAIMGGVELDLRAAGTATGEAIIDVFVMWGGVEIWVPPEWAVVNNGGVLMGGVEDKSTGTQDARHRLIVRGFVVMGGLEIKT
jgi:hypothetical protein